MRTPNIHLDNKKLKGKRSAYRIVKYKHEGKKGNSQLASKLHLE